MVMAEPMWATVAAMVVALELASHTLRHHIRPAAAQELADTPATVEAVATDTVQEKLLLVAPAGAPAAYKLHIQALAATAEVLVYWAKAPQEPTVLLVKTGARVLAE